jgi:hypothetical protein
MVIREKALVWFILSLEGVKNTFQILCFAYKLHHWEDLDVGGWTILKWILER